MQIGKIKFEGKAFLAPMAGVTDGVFRAICRRFGAACVYSEMISAKGLYYGDKKTKRLMIPSSLEHPYAVQIFGSDPDITAEIIPEVCETGCDFIDINMGCPAPKIVSGGDGCALMKNLTLAGEMMKKAVRVSTVPVTAKIRMGWDHSDICAVEAAKILEECGASAIAVHGRTRADFYSGSANWDIIRQVKETVKIPVMGNGDIVDAYAAQNMLRQTGCDAVMIGRGARGNPFIFAQVNELLSSGEIKTVPCAADKIKLASQHVRALVRAKGEYIGVRESRKHIAWYVKGLPMSAPLKEKAFAAQTLSQVESALNEYLSLLSDKGFA